MSISFHRGSRPCACSTFGARGGVRAYSSSPTLVSLLLLFAWSHPPRNPWDHAARGRGVPRNPHPPSFAIPFPSPRTLQPPQNPSHAQDEVVAYVRRRSSAFSRGRSRFRGVSGHNGRWEARIGTFGGRKNVRAHSPSPLLAGGRPVGRCLCHCAQLRWGKGGAGGQRVRSPSCWLEVASRLAAAAPPAPSHPPQPHPCMLAACLPRHCMYECPNAVANEISYYNRLCSSAHQLCSNYIPNR